MVVVATTKAAETNTAEQGDSNATLLQPAGSYIYYRNREDEYNREKECTQKLTDNIPIKTKHVLYYILWVI